MKRKDLLTQEEFVPARINQRFANSKNRIKYHNNRAKEFRLRYAYIDKALHRNVKILNELMKDKKEGEFHKQFLLGKGYDFNVHTHVECLDDKNYYAVYQYIVISLENNKIKIISYDG